MIEWKLVKKLATVRHIDGSFYAWIFQCPGCHDVHLVDGRWSFNNDQEKPTFQPSLKRTRPGYCCHSFVRDGKIQFLGDCTHELAGQTVEIPDWDGWGGYE